MTSVTCLEIAIQKCDTIHGVERNPSNNIDLTDQLQDQIDQIDVIPSIQSDHSTLKLKVCGTKCSSKGPSYWKLMNSLPQDKVFTERFKS